MWDDYTTIFKNPNLTGLSLQNIYLAFTTSLGRYAPLSILTRNAIYDYFHLNPFGYHLVSWLLHGLSSGLLFLIIRKILLLSLTIQSDNRKVHRHINIAASLAALFWALHPLRVESVAWISSSGHNQALFLSLLSTLCYLEAIASESNKKRYIYLMGSAFIFYTLSLFSSPIAITCFAVFFVFDIFLFKRIGGAVGWWKSRTAKKVLFEKLILTTPVILVGILTVIFQFKHSDIWGTPAPLSEFGLFERIMQAMYIIPYYIWRHFYPVDLSPVYTTLVSFDPLSMPFIFSAFSVMAATIVLFIFRKRWPIGLALLSAYIILLIPVMGFFEHPHSHADRYSLISSICLSILIAFGLINLMKNKYFSVISVSVLVIINSTLGLLSFNQVKIWNNSESLFTHMIKTLKNDPYQQDIYWRLGKYLLNKGKKEEAIINFEKTLSINPYYPIANNYLVVAYGKRGIDYLNLGQYQAAIEDFNKTIRLKPDFAAAYKYRAFAYLKQGNKERGCYDAQKSCALGDCELLEMAKGNGTCH